MLAAPHGQRVVDLAKRAQGARGLIAGGSPSRALAAGARLGLGLRLWFSRP